METDPFHKALGYTLLAYMISMIAVVTLIPFSFAVPKAVQFTWRGNYPDVFNNIVLFVPLGFFFHTTHARAGWKSFFQAFGFGLAVSAVVEAGQLFLPSRFSSGIDIVTNGLGAGLGAVVAGYHRLLVKKGRMPELFDFGLPLITSVFLLVPLLWLGAISMGSELSRLGLMALVGIFGAGAIASALVNRCGPGMPPPRFAVFGDAIVWFMIGAAPALATFPVLVSALGVVVGSAAQLSSRMWKRPNPADRRFELPTLKRLLPVYLSYLLLLSVWPTTVPLGGWPDHGNFQWLGQAERVLFIARFVEMIAAFTLLGFLVAEMSGRKDVAGVHSLRRVLVCTTGLAMVAAALRNVHLHPLYTLVDALIFSIAAVYGAVIYRLQRAVVRRNAAAAKAGGDGQAGRLFD